MHVWIDLILQPFKDEQDARDLDGSPAILTLDVYYIQMMGSVVNQIQSMGIEVIHILESCTYLCQPVDAGIKKPLKSAMHKRWKEWMMNCRILDRKAKELFFKQVAKWLIDAYDHIPEHVTKNAWLKKGSMSHPNGWSAHNDCPLLFGRKPTIIS